ARRSNQKDSPLILLRDERCV
ncbi:hypothetical protein CSUI_006382, partial [Cystoisospora suis]